MQVELKGKTFDTKEDDEGCQLQKPQMKNDEDKKKSHI